VGKQELTDAGPGKPVMAWPIDTAGNYADKSHSIFMGHKGCPLRHQAGDHDSNRQVGDGYDQHDLIFDSSFLLLFRSTPNLKYGKIRSEFRRAFRAQSGRQDGSTTIHNIVRMMQCLCGISYEIS
jgi:hypothetical protein